MVVDQKGVWFGGGESYADVVCGGVQGVKRDVRVLVKAVRRELESAQVWSLGSLCFHATLVRRRISKSQERYELMVFLNKV